MKMLVKKSSTEISWHGFVKRLDKNVFQLYDIILFPQYNTGATSKTDEEDYTNWILKQMNYDNFEEMRLHGHSHVSMSCTPSGTDMSYREELLTNLKDNDFYIFIIMNKQHQKTIELYDAETHTVYETSDIEYIIGNAKEIEKATAWAETAMKKNIKEKVICSTTSKAVNSLTRPRSAYLSMLLEQERLDQEFVNNYLD